VEVEATCRFESCLQWVAIFKHITALSTTGRRAVDYGSLVCLNMVRQGVVCRCCRSTEDRDSLPSNTGTILKHTKPLVESGVDLQATL
jgi:hypothetical protein